MKLVAKQILAIGLPVATVAVTGAAVAYWSTTGLGSGSAGTAAGASSLTVTQASAPSGMGPGVPAGGITVTVTNPGPSTARANQVVVSISSVTGGAGACTAADYNLAGATMTTGAAELAASGSTTFSGASLGFNNTAANQDGCKGATVNLAYAVS